MNRSKAVPCIYLVYIYIFKLLQTYFLGAIVMNDVQLDLTESALRLYADSGPERDMSKVYDEGNLCW